MSTLLKVAYEYKYEYNYILHDIVIVMHLFNKQFKQFQLSLENRFQSQNGINPLYK